MIVAESKQETTEEKRCVWLRLKEEKKYLTQ